MPGWFRTRAADSTLLLVAAAVLTLPNLGRPSLWDVDEGVNAEAAREMREAGTWVIPTFNFELRTAKPALLYWLQRASYDAFGVSEWSARLPSVLAGWLTVLLTYELARRLFDRATGLLAGLVLASAVEFCLLAHAATPDATLLLFTVLTYLLFWVGHAKGGRAWWVPTAAACGLAALTKGPVGVALPGLVFLLYFAWNRELRRLLDRRLGVGGADVLIGGRAVVRAGDGRDPRGVGEGVLPDGERDPGADPDGGPPRPGVLPRGSATGAVRPVERVPGRHGVVRRAGGAGAGGGSEGVAGVSAEVVRPLTPPASRRPSPPEGRGWASTVFNHGRATMRQGPNPAGRRRNDARPRRGRARPTLSPPGERVAAKQAG